MTKDSLGDRMKGYENVTRNYLTRRVPVAIRLDGKAFHTFTKGMKRPFDPIFVECMQESMKRLCEKIQGVAIGYQQSDEITLVLTDYANIETLGWMGYNIQKMASISASILTASFNRIYSESVANIGIDDIFEHASSLESLRARLNNAYFDSRVFNIPKDEVCNMLIWRQQDATRNSIEMAGRAYFSHKQLTGVSCAQIQEKLWAERGVNWNDYPTDVKRGSCCARVEVEEPLDDETWNKIAAASPDSAPPRTVKRSRWIIDHEIPIFTQDRDYVNSRIGYSES